VTSSVVTSCGDVWGGGGGGQVPGAGIECLFSSTYGNRCLF